MKAGNCIEVPREKAMKAVNAVANVGEPRRGKKRFLVSVAGSILKYGAPAWTAALSTKRNRPSAKQHIPTHGHVSRECLQNHFDAGSMRDHRDESFLLFLAKDVECYQRRNDRIERKEHNQSGFVRVG